MEVMPDHVHLFIKSDPTNSPHYIVQQMKGYTSRILRKEYDQLRSKLLHYGLEVIILNQLVIFLKIRLNVI